MVVDRQLAPLGQALAKKSTVFSLLPRCHGHLGSQEQTSTLKRTRPDPDPHARPLRLFCGADHRHRYPVAGTEER
jgi:hypothetical protein